MLIVLRCAAATKSRWVVHTRLVQCMAELSRQYSAGIGSRITHGQLLIAQTPLTISRAIATGAVGPVFTF